MEKIVIKSCPICRDEAISQAYDKLPKLQPDFMIFECKKCHFAFQNPQIKDVDKTIADEEYVTSADLHLAKALGHVKEDGSIDKESNARFWNIRILDHLERFRQTNYIYDVGAGLGYLVIAAINKGWKAIGLEYAEEKIRFAKKRYGLTLHANLPKDAIPGDGVILCNVVEHVFDPHDVLKYATKLCRSGGCLFIETPNYASYTRRYLGKLWSDFAQNHVSFYLPSHLIKLCEENGFSLDFLETGGILLGDTESLLSKEQRLHFDEYVKMVRKNGKLESGSTIFAYFVKSSRSPIEILDMFAISKLDGGVIGPLTKSMIVSQTFDSDNDNLCRVDIQIATYGGQSKCTGEILVEQYDENSKNYIQARRILVDLSICKDNDLLPIRFEPVLHSGGKKFRLVIKSDAEENHRGFAIRKDSNLIIRNFNLEINGKKENGTLIFKTYYLSNDIPKNFEFGIMINARPKNIASDAVRQMNN